VAENEPRLEEIASAVLDGTAIDWEAAESSMAGVDRPLLSHLRSVAALAAVHRLPTAWGHLQVIERIGRGTFGEVYRAFDSRLDREVALKLLPAAQRADGSTAPFFIPEGRLLARVHHSNIVTIHGAEQIAGQVGLWMELVRGRTLEQVLGQRGQFSVAEATRIGRDLCGAVSAVHAAGLLHRDIKAHNVMLADDGRVVLMDFGTGREVGDDAVSDLAGTPLYVAPEVLDGQRASIQCDVYSLGVLVFHILSGKYPVEGRSLSDIRTAHRTGSRVRLRDVRPDVPEPLARVIERAVNPSPEGRFATAAAFSAALERVTAGLGRRRILFGAAAIISILLGGILIRNTRPDGSLPGVPAIAVLPFENRGSEPNSEELADGLTDEIQRNLAIIDGLALRSSSSSFFFKSKPRDVASIGSQLSVDYVVEGSVAASSGAIQIDARLTRVAGDTTVWAARFERDVKDLATVLGEISRAIVNELRVTLGRGQRRYDLDPDLFYKFLQARAFHGRRGPENSARAAELFQQIVARAPEYAPAWAGLAGALAQLSRPSTGEVIIPPDPRLGPAALKALQLDPLLAEAHAALGNMYARDRDWVNARMSFLKALTLNASLTETHNDFVLGVLMPIGDTAEALRQLDAARIADPLSLDVRRTQAHIFVEAGRYQDAIENCLWIRQHDPAFPFVDVWLGRALYLSGRFEEAQEALERAGPEFWGYVGYLLAVSGRREEAQALAARHPDASSRTMLIYAGLGDTDRAYEGLRRTAEINWWRAATWLHRPEMALIRDDPRMPALKKMLGLPE
jgi:serine/threonine protein kinase/tetratricopeptide (TPR) repeat protein